MSIAGTDPGAATAATTVPPMRHTWARWGLWVALATAFSAKSVERNFAWSSSKALWGESFRLNPTSAHTCQNYAIQLSGDGEAGMRRAAEVLQSVRALPEVDRVDTDEVYTALALNLRNLNRWAEALEVLAEGWARQEARQAALDRGVKLWHMHALDPVIEDVPLRRGRLLAAQATTMAHVDLAESARAMVRAVELAPRDSVVLQMAGDLERYIAGSYHRDGLTPQSDRSLKPPETLAFEEFMRYLERHMSAEKGSFKE